MKIEVINLTDDPNITLTAYIADNSPEMKKLDTRPAMLVLPGGGYRFCSDREAEPVALEYLAKGFNAFILRYSLNEKAKFPTPLNDATAALKYIRKNAKKYNINPKMVAVIGFSAGGHLAAALSTMSDEKPDACVLGYPCIIDNLGHVLANPVPSLEKMITDKTPPTFIFAATDDQCVPIIHSLAYATSLDANKIPFEMHMFQKGGHGFSTGDKIVFEKDEWYNNAKETNYWVKRSVDWLREIFSV